MRIIGDAGAYGGFGGALAMGPTRNMAQGPYKIPKAYAFCFCFFTFCSIIVLIGVGVSLAPPSLIVLTYNLN